MTVPTFFGPLSSPPTRRPAEVAAAKERRRRPASPYGPHGRMFVVAADHAARGALRAGADPMAMGDRRELLRRLCLVLQRPEANGVLGSPDVIEELLLLGALEDKTVFGSMNRGGLQDSSFEIDDRFTGFTAGALSRSGFDGGKMLLRIDVTDAGTVNTLEACSRAVDALAEHELMAMVEPFISHRVDGRVRNELTAEAMIRAVGIAAALGSTAAYTWLKIPAVPNLERVLAASTLPALILGGEVAADQEATFKRWAAALQMPGVYGLVVGRPLLFPPDDDVESAVDTAIALL